MASLSTYTTEQAARSSLVRTRGVASPGFTLIEVLIVFALLTFVGSIGFFVSIDTYRGSSFRSDRDLLVTLLQHSRSQAVGNMCFGSACTDGQPHGVRIEDDRFVLFQGLSYAAADHSLDSALEANTAIDHLGAMEFVFMPVTGEANPSGSITLRDQNARESVITIEPEGRIVWTN
jgi:Tfp pilus assembly protein FimT